MKRTAGSPPRRRRRFGAGSTATRESPDARTSYRDDDATLDDLREAVTTLEEIERIARRVFGSTHPLTTGIEDELQNARAALGGSLGGSSKASN